jgi:uncharacterized Zn finger protein
MGDTERRVNMMCPTCGGEQFSFDEHDDSALVTCVTCGRQTTRDALVEENSERIESELKQLGDQVLGDLARDLRRKGFK